MRARPLLVVSAALLLLAGCRGSTSRGTFLQTGIPYPGAAQLHLVKAREAMEAGNIEAAREAYGRALEAEPSNEEARQSLQHLTPGPAAPKAGGH